MLFRKHCLLILRHIVFCRVCLCLPVRGGIFLPFVKCGMCPVYLTWMVIFRFGWLFQLDETSSVMSVHDVMLSVSAAVTPWRRTSPCIWLWFSVNMKFYYFLQPRSISPWPLIFGSCFCVLFGEDHRKSETVLPQKSPMLWTCGSNIRHIFVTHRLISNLMTM